jgi:hypothetical protein
MSQSSGQSAAIPPAMPVPGGAPGGAARPRNPKKRQKIVLAVFLLVVVAFFAVVYFATRHNADTAKVGDCVSQSGENSVKVVKCDDPAAAFKVVGRLQGKTQDEATTTACKPFEGAGAQQAYWQGVAGQTGLVLCLAPTAG